MSFGSPPKVSAPPPDRASQEAADLANRIRRRAADATEDLATREGTILGSTTGGRQTSTSAVQQKTLLGA